MADLGSTLDLPFEEGPPGQYLDLEHAKLSGGCVVLASVLPIPGDPKPALVFRFTSPDGRFYAPIVLGIDPAQAEKLPILVNRAVRAAIKAAEDAR